MMIRYITKPIDTLSHDTLCELRSMTNKKGSYMNEMLDHYENNRSNGHGKQIVIIVRQNSEYLGWAMILKRRTRADLMFYIKNKYRRDGIGSELMKRTERYLKRKGIKKIFASAWDDRSLKFFTSLGFKKNMGDQYTHDPFYWAKNV